MATTTAAGGRPPLWRDVRVLRVAFQVAVLAAVVAFVAYLYDNLQANDVELDFGFLDQQAGFRIAYTDLRPSDTVLDAMLTGLRNTVTVALVGIVLTLVVGTVVGIARLSGNWIVRHVAGAYVEVLRNVPPLLVIVFVNAGALATLPPIQEADRIDGLLVLSVSEIGVVSLRGDGHGWPYRHAGTGRGGRRRSACGGPPGGADGHPGRRWLWSGARAGGGGGGLPGAGRAGRRQPPGGRRTAHQGRQPHGPAVRLGARRARALHLVARGRDRAGSIQAVPRARPRRRRPASAPASASATSCCPRRSASPPRRSSTSASTSRRTRRWASPSPSPS